MIFVKGKIGDAPGREGFLQINTVDEWKQNKTEVRGKQDAQSKESCEYQIQNK